jgi:predicted transcriptional regulator
MACKSKYTQDQLDLVLKTLRESNEPMKNDDIAEKTGMEKDDVSKIVAKLKKNGDVESPKRCYYTAV